MTTTPMRATIAAAAFLLGSCATVRPASLGAFVDPLIEAHLREARIPGAVFVYVKDGRVLYAKGYGYADAEKKTPVSPEKTIWRIGSITKVFTATAMMQLADHGSID